MRAGAGFNAAAAAPVVAAGAGAHSAWHSPVPYLFGGLAAMLGLIAFALLILACSYWKLSGYLAAGDGAAEPAPSAGEKIPATAMAAAVKYEEKVVVIMAGDAKPTFLATPVTSRASSFGDNGGESKLKTKNEKETAEAEEEEEKEEDEKDKHTQTDIQNFTQNHEEV